MPKPQSAASHAKYDPITHFVLLPIFFINFIAAIVHAFRDPFHRPLFDLWLIILALALLLLVAKQRIYSLGVQNRVIRLEERLRIAALTSPAQAHQLSLPQLIALRFAPDVELPTLVTQALAESLTSPQIKQRIATWRPDDIRV